MDDLISKQTPVAGPGQGSQTISPAARTRLSATLEPLRLQFENPLSDQQKIQAYRQIELAFEDVFPKGVCIVVEPRTMAYVEASNAVDALMLSVERFGAKRSAYSFCVGRPTTIGGGSWML